MPKGVKIILSFGCHALVVSHIVDSPLTFSGSQLSEFSYHETASDERVWSINGYKKLAYILIMIFSQSEIDHDRSGD